MEVFRLEGVIDINNKPANDALDKTQSKTQSFGDKLKKGMGTAVKWGTAVVGATTAVAGSVVAFGVKSAQSADHVDKMSQKIGVSRKAYQELAFVCSQSGTDVDQLQQGMKSLTAAMDGARNGVSSNVEQFERLGVAVTNSDGSFRKQEDVFFDTVAALQGVSDETERARLATELFGRSGTELLPLLNSGAGSMDEMRKKAQELGLVLDDSTIDAGVRLTDTLDQLQRSVGAVFMELADAVMPVIEEVFGAVRDYMPQIKDAAGQLSPVISQLLDDVLPPLMDLAKDIFPLIMDVIKQLVPPLGELVKSLMPVIVDVLKMLLPPLTQIIKDVLPIVVDLIKDLLPIIKPILELLKPIISLLLALIKPLMRLIKAVLPPLIKIIEGFANVLSTVLQPIIEFIAEVIEVVLISVIDWLAERTEKNVKIISDLWQWLKDTLYNIYEGIKNSVKSAFEWVKNFISNIYEGIKNTIKNAMDTVKNTIRGVLDGIKNIFTSVFNGIKGFIGGVVGGISSLIGNGINGAYNTVRGILDRIYGAFSNTFNNVKNFVSGVVGWLKGAFNFNWSLPKLKLPHIKIKGHTKILGVSIPKIGIDWYSKAMDKGMIMNKPTIFGYNPYSNNFLAGGEAGSETVVGTQSLMNMITTAVNAQQNKTAQELQRINQLLQQYLPQIFEKETALVLDTGVLVGQITPKVDTELNSMYRLKQRW